MARRFQQCSQASQIQPLGHRRAQQNRQREKGNPLHTITNFYVAMNYNNIPYMPSKRYKVVNPYAVCHKMKKNYGWTGHNKWQRCVDKIKAKSGRKR
jgi:hypothetical protein